MPIVGWQQILRRITSLFGGGGNSYFPTEPCPKWLHIQMGARQAFISRAHKLHRPDNAQLTNKNLPLVVFLCKKMNSVHGSMVWSLVNMVYSDIQEGCVLFGPRNSRFFIFSDRILTISHAMYLVSNKVASNEAKITVFLHFLYN